MMNRNSYSPVAIPSLDELALTPALAAGLPLDTLATLAMRCAAVQSALAAAALDADARTTPKRAAAEPDEWLDEKQAAKLLHRPTRCLFRNATRLPFISRTSRKHLLVSRKGIERWLATQRV